MPRKVDPDTSNPAHVLDTLLPIIQWKAERVIATLKAMMSKAIQETDRDAAGKLSSLQYIQHSTCIVSLPIMRQACRQAHTWRDPRNHFIGNFTLRTSGS